VPLLQRMLMGSFDALGKVLSEAEGCDPSSLLSTDQATPGVLCLVLGLPSTRDI